MTRSNIKTKDGRISAYGFACGYIEAVENGYKRATILMEHGVYHVQWKLDDGELYRYWTREGNGWATFDALADARKQYDKVKKEVER
jgi:hypothetical protein